MLKRKGVGMKKLSIVMVLLFLILAVNLSYVSANTNQYTYKDRTIDLNLKPIAKDQRHDFYLKGDHLVWVEGWTQSQIFYKHLPSGEVRQITDHKGQKKYPVVTESSNGAIILWTDNLNKGSYNLLSYNLKTKKLEQLSKETSVGALRADGDYAIYTKENLNEIFYYNLITNKETYVEKGTFADIKNNKIIFSGGGEKFSGKHVIYDIATGAFQSKSVGYTGVDFNFNGKHVVMRSSYNNGTERITLVQADQFEKIHKTLRDQKSPSGSSEILIGDTYGVILLEKQGKIELTGIDLLYEEMFPLGTVTGSLDQFLGFKANSLVYFSGENKLTYRTIESPLGRSVRNSDPIHVHVDGEQLTFNAPPLIINGTTYVEFRTIFEKLGYTIKWDGQTKTIVGKSKDSEIRLVIDKKTALVNGKEKQLERAPFIKHGYTYVPLRFIGEGSNRDVRWDAATKTVYINKNDSGDTLYYPNGYIKYVGDVVNGIREGFGIGYREDKNGVSDYIGEWKNDKKHGEGISFYLFAPDEISFIGTYFEGKRVEGTEFYPGGGLRYEGNYKNGLYNDGIAVDFIGENGEYRVGEMRNGIITGKVTEYYGDGTIRFEGTYHDYKRVEGKLYNRNGKLIYEGRYDAEGNPLGSLLN